MTYDTPSGKRLVLVSSSGDLSGARKHLSDKLRARFNDLQIRLDSFLWEEATDYGAMVTSSNPIQRQIDEMLSAGLTMTLAMFGERLGEPIKGELPDGANNLLKDWEPLGLTHPWPEAPEERWAELERGRFPLTGTVYEVLVALKIARDNPGFVVLIGYAADRDIKFETKVGGIRFNHEQWANASKEGPEGSEERARWSKQTYQPQVQGIINFINALTNSSHGCFAKRYESDGVMADRLASSAILAILRAIALEAHEQVIKPDFSHYAVDDPFSFPDRERLRERLKSLLYTEGNQGRMLVLRGPSGCGKSSLLQKGLLGDLPDSLRGSIIMALRPTDLSLRGEPTPLLRLLGSIADTLEEAGLSKLGPLRKPAGATHAARLEAATRCIESALAEKGSKLVLGMDQFEEILDFSSLEPESQRDAGASWWQVLRFLGRALKLNRVWLAATLEKQRQRHLEELDIQTLTGLDISWENVDLPVATVAEFVSSVAEMGGLKFSRDACNAIMRMVETFEDMKARDPARRSSASFLPLLSLWLHRVLTTFKDRAETAEHSISGKFDKQKSVITIEDLKAHQIKLELGALVESLVRDAWEEAGLLNELNPSAGPNEIALDNFLSGLVSIDQDNNMQLNAISKNNEIPSISKLITSHLKRRLLEPVGHDRVRLTHQAIIDNWPPASTWYQMHTRDLKRIRSMHHVALEHGLDVDFEQLASSKPEWVKEAASILCMKRATWLNSAVSTAADPEFLMRRFCLGLIDKAPDGRLQFELGNHAPPIAIEAARYDLHEALERWLTQTPALAEWTSPESEENLLHKAAWSAPNAVRALLRHHAQFDKSDSEGWHPIEASIQTNCYDAFKQLYVHYGNPRCVIGPHGRTIIHSAAFNKDHRILRFLVDESSDIPSVDLADDDGITPLHIAAGNGCLQALNLLMDYADPHLRDRYFRSFVHYAVSIDCKDTIQAIFTHPKMGDTDQSRLLNGEVDESSGWMTPLTYASVLAKPAALAALLQCCDPQDRRHRRLGQHPVAAVFHNYLHKSDNAEWSAPKAERMTACVRLLLDDGRLTQEDAYDALAGAHQFPTAHRLIQNWLFDRGSFDKVGDAVLLDWMTGPENPIALRVLREQPRLLDCRDGDGETGASLLLRKNRHAALAVALRENILPAEHTDLFRLEAALCVIKAAKFADSEASPERRPDALAGIEASTLHPIIVRLMSDDEDRIGNALLRMTPYAGFGSLLHRLAALSALDIFYHVLSGLTGPVPTDAYGRPPSSLAPPRQRPNFAALESSHITADHGTFEKLDDSALIRLMTGSEPRIALRVLRQQPRLLDCRDGDGETGASLLLRGNSHAALAVALRENLLPKEHTDLFRLEAALTVIKAARPADGEASPERIRNALADIEASTLHPLIVRLMSDDEDSIGNALLRLIPRGGFGSLLHVLAARNALDMFDHVLSGLSGPIPVDAYGRPPSSLAPPKRRPDFVALETSRNPQASAP